MDRSVQGRKVQTGYTAHIEAQTHEIQNTELRPDHNIWNHMSCSFLISVWFPCKPCNTEEAGDQAYSL